MIVDQFEEMLEESSGQPLVFGLALHGYIVGQPYRMRRLRVALQHCLQPKPRAALDYPSQRYCELLHEPAVRHYSGQLGGGRKSRISS